MFYFILIYININNKCVRFLISLFFLLLGGGYYGGGGGCESQGGGGGSSYSQYSTLHNIPGINAGHGWIEITFFLPVPTALPSVVPSAKPTVLPTIVPTTIVPSAVPSRFPIYSPQPTTATSAGWVTKEYYLHSSNCSNSSMTEINAWPKDQCILDRDENGLVIGSFRLMCESDNDGSFLRTDYSDAVCGQIEANTYFGGGGSGGIGRCVSEVAFDVKTSCVQSNAPMSVPGCTFSWGYKYLVLDMGMGFSCNFVDPSQY